MGKQKPGTPKGTRDFGPEVLSRRQYIIQICKQVFENFGFQGIATPAMENLNTLLGKYGDEGDKLLFRILNSGDFTGKVNEKDWSEKNTQALSAQISEKGLRYDLTIPLARYVAMNHHDLAFPFKRYQIQPVWRADRPQKGRYREFFQCDVDVVGTDSLLCEAELIQIYNRVFHNLKIPIEIKINHRKILEGIAELAGCREKFPEMTVAIDKLDKIGEDAVCEEMIKRNITEKSAKTILDLLNDHENLPDRLKKTEAGQKGIAELGEIRRWLENLPHADFAFEPTLARGLSYYTGTILEVKAKSVNIGSIGGGGRYDDLCGLFGLPGVSGVGVSFGLDRIYDVMDELGCFTRVKKHHSKVLCVHFEGEAGLKAFRFVTLLRSNNIGAELYPEPDKLKKQFKYADQKGIPFVITIGEAELESGKYGLKNMESGEQISLTESEIIEKLTYTG